MSSKKHRKRIKVLYRKHPILPALKQVKAMPKGKISQAIIDFLEELRSFSAIFPEISSRPIKLGVPFEVTIKIGDDAPQEKRLVVATLILPTTKNERDLLEGLIKLPLDISHKTITALPARSQPITSPVLRVLYPLPIGGYAMYPMPIFNWYGRDKVVISKIEECAEAVGIIKTRHYEPNEMIWAGNLIGRQLDGMEVLVEQFAE